ISPQSVTISIEFPESTTNWTLAPGALPAKEIFRYASKLRYKEIVVRGIVTALPTAFTSVADNCERERATTPSASCAADLCAADNTTRAWSLGREKCTVIGVAGRNVASLLPRIKECECLAHKHAYG